MSDYFPAEIHIGGPVPRAVLRKLFKAILTEGVSLEDYGGPEVTEASLREVFHEGVIVDLYDVRASYGEFERLEAFLVKHRIHFDRHSDASYEYDAENVYYRGGPKAITMLAGQNGDPLVRGQAILAILEGDSQDAQNRLEAIRRLISPPEMSTLEPIEFTGGASCPKRRG